ncbi:methyltransferase, FkbM family [Mucilaginibacter sp. OK098]|nr:methyltransferase, FkbM family [Mucilaginibacter sp. OK098]
MKRRFLTTIQNILASSRIITLLAFKVRNQCNRIIVQRYAVKSMSPDINGEYLVLNFLMPTCNSYFDVGANKGNWSSYILENSGNNLTSIYLYEPGNSAFSIISDRFKDLSNVQITKIALSDHIGKLDFYEQENAGELSSASEKWVSGNSSKIEVETSTLDSELSRLQLKHLDYLKIDTEGFDLKILKGAMDAITHHKIGFIQFEYNYVWTMTGSTLLSAYELLEGCGYKVYLIKPDGLYTYDVRKNGEFFAFSNFLAISPSNTLPLKRIVKGAA